jgi:hypothetical protein
MFGRLLPLSPRLALVPLSLLLLGGGCTGTSKKPQTPEQAFAAVTAAAKEGDTGAAHVYTLLDEKSRWSAISAHKDRRAICALIKAHYPQQSRKREMRRCSLAARAKTTKAWFAAHARRERLLAPLAALTRVEGRSDKGDRVTLSSGGHKLAFCKQEGAWTYCGLREHIEQLKLKSARDLTTVRENAEAYKQGR